MKIHQLLQIALLFLLVLAGGCMSGRSTEKIPAVTGFELPRYLGAWYEIARLPHRFERGMDRVTAEYTQNPDGTVKVVNRGFRDGVEHRAEGIAKFSGKPTVGELEVSFFRPFYGDYRIIQLDPEYRHAVVTSSTDDYLWILARTPQLPDDELLELVEYARKCGFATDRLEFSGQENSR
ncbi:lipocalin family protein [uncultured Victivallis sp.]|uniref:lipocalin family protein n=1 Tax=uncultured Victivallis sp. TaxID=354118 RepID=UPI002595510A|nr:lipocalin family protein [uncultured Victivallis sp.]